ncbi:hypothetical protein BY996DRAFT_6504814 [Phakopsora pachyrhizi]|nr:hypothetical protein BY996DRAFT_6504814 [Phakopsora pachyrhizi]
MDERLEVSRKLPLWVSPTLPMSLFEKEVRHERDKGPFSSSVSSFEFSVEPRVPAACLLVPACPLRELVGTSSSSVKFGLEKNIFLWARLGQLFLGNKGKLRKLGKKELDEFEVVRGRALKGSFESNDDFARRGEGLRFKPFDQRIRGCPNGRSAFEIFAKKKTDFDRQNREICKREEKGRRDHNSQDILADPSLLAIGAKNTILYRIRGQKDVDCCTILRPEKMEKAKVDEFEGDEACAMDCLYIDTYSRWEVEKSLQIHNIRPITHTQPPRGD